MGIREYTWMRLCDLIIVHRHITSKLVVPFTEKLDEDARRLVVYKGLT